MQYTRVIVSAGVVLVALSGLAATPDKPQTLAEIRAAYNGELKKSNSVPTVAAAYERARKLFKRPDLVDKEGEMLRGLRKWETPGCMAIIAKLPKADEAVLKELRDELAENAGAYEEIRKALRLPAGLPPFYEITDKDGVISLRAAFSLARGLERACYLRLWEENAAEAQDWSLSITRLQRMMRDAPFSMDQFVGAGMALYATETALVVALSGNLDASQLDTMATLVSPDPSDVSGTLLATVRYERAFCTDVFDRLEAGDKDLMTLILGWAAELDKIAGMKRALTSDAILKDIPKARKIHQEVYEECEKIVQQPGKKLKDVPRDDSNYFLSLPGPGLSMLHDEVLRGLVRGRAAATLLRALAFKAKNGRLPREDELKLPENPFRPGQRLTYKEDKENHRVGVYAVGWDSEDPKEKPPMIGYWLVLE